MVLTSASSCSRSSPVDAQSLVHMRSDAVKPVKHNHAQHHAAVHRRPAAAIEGVTVKCGTNIASISHRDELRE